MKINLNYFINLAQKNKKIPTLVVPCPYEKDTIVAIYKCIKLKLVKAILVGQELKILKIIKNLKIPLKNFVIVNVNNDLDAIEKTMHILKAKKADILMKGIIDTSILLKSFLNKEYGFRNKTMSHCVLAFNPNYKNYYLISDPAMIIKPTLEQKQAMIENAVFLAHKLGIKKPYVANLCAKEKEYEKMNDTIEASILRKLNQEGVIKNCVVSGPLQIDIAIDKKSALIKKVKDPVAGKANILICPNIEAANIFAKGISYLGGWSFAGVVLGAKIPFVLTSRSTNEQDNMLSIILACICIK